MFIIIIIIIIDIYQSVRNNTFGPDIFTNTREATITKTRILAKRSLKHNEMIIAHAHDILVTLPQGATSTFFKKDHNLL